MASLGATPTGKLFHLLLQFSKSCNLNTVAANWY